MVFCLLYVPCVATLVTIKKESSARWMWVAVAFQVLTAWVLSFAVYQLGSLLGLG